MRVNYLETKESLIRIFENKGFITKIPLELLSGCKIAIDFCSFLKNFIKNKSKSTDNIKNYIDSFFTSLNNIKIEGIVVFGGVEITSSSDLSDQLRIIEFLISRIQYEDNYLKCLEIESLCEYCEPMHVNVLILHN